MPALEHALADYSNGLARDKALYLSWLAESYIDASEPEQAAATTQHRISLASNTTSVRPQQRIGMVLDRLQKFQQIPAVNELLLHRSLYPR